MAVKVEKSQEILREKISEYSYDRIPPEMMPSGSVIQTVTKLNDEESINTNSASYILNQYKFHPRLADSRLLIIAEYRNVTGNTDNFTSAKYYWGTDESDPLNNDRLDSNANTNTGDRGKNGFMYLCKNETGGSQNIMNQTHTLRDVPVYCLDTHYLTIQIDNSSNASCVVGRHSAGWTLVIQEIRQ
jgi:hypothetical protein